MGLFRPGKPGFRVHQASVQAVAAGAQDLTFDALDFEDPAGWDGVSLYTVDRAGLYLMYLSAARGTAAVSSTIIVRLRVNGLTVASRASLSTGAGVSESVSYLGHLQAGDNIRGNVTFHATLATTSNPSQTFMHAVRVGPVRWT